MKKLLIASALSAAFVSPAVFAQANGFTGIYGQASVGVGSSQTRVDTTYTNTTYNNNGSQSFGDQNVAGSLALGYNYGFSNGFNLGANIFYNFKDNSSGSQNFFENNAGVTYSDNTSLQLKDMWGVSIEPGYSFAPSSLGYVKLGWAQAKASGSSSIYDNGVFNSEESGGISKTTNGFLYGVGYKHLLTKNIYIGVEVYQIAFSNVSRSQADEFGGVGKVTLKPTYTYGGLVIGAKF
jgi:outer membrane immunogenic protein